MGGEQELTKNCPSCRAVIPADAAVCPNCLARLVLLEVAGPPAPEVQEVPAPPRSSSVRQHVFNIIMGSLALLSLGFAAWLLWASRSVGESVLDRADSLYANGLYREAAGAYRAVLQEDPDNQAAWLRLGTSLLHLGQINEARQVFEEALTRNPTSAEARLGAGKAAYLAGDLARARDHLEQARALAPGLSAPYSYLGQIYAEQGRWEQAAEALRAALERRPDDVAAASRLADAYLALSRPEEALRVLQDAALWGLNSSEVNRRLGQAYLLADRSQEALQALQIALQASPDDLELLVLAGQAAYRAGNLSAAEAYVNQALGHSQAVRLGAQALETLGRILLAQGKDAEAETRLRQALILYPDSSARAPLGQAILEQRGCAEALPWFQKALRLDPNSAEATKGLRVCSGK